MCNTKQTESVWVLLVLVHREFESGKSMADNGGPVRVILNRRSLGFTSFL